MQKFSKICFAFVVVILLSFSLLNAPAAKQTTAAVQKPPIAVPVVYTSVPQIISIRANDDSALVSFTPVRGAIDYRAYTVYQDGSMIHPARIKYSGGSLSIEVNGIKAPTGADIVVEAVDAQGPFQDMDPANMPLMDMIINGQGAPANAPNVMIVNGIPSRSAITHLTPRPVALEDDQVFFDNFREEQPFVAIPPAQQSPEMRHMHIVSGQVLYQQYQNDKWNLHLFDHDASRTKVFFMSNHFMDILYDFHQILRAKMVMIPRSYPTLAAGETLHVTWEVDAYLDLNRTLGCAILPANAAPDFNMWNDLPSSHGPSLDAQINGAACNVALGDGLRQVGLPGVSTPRWHQQWPGGPMGGGLNGGDGDLDKRHHFDLYLNSTSMKILEQGQVVRSCTFATPQHWVEDQPLQVCFYHYLYHSSADDIYERHGEMYPRTNYWLNHRPSADERHWDNMGFEVTRGIESISQ